MTYSTRVLSVFVLQVMLVNCFPWDIVVGVEKRLEFYYNGTLTHTEVIPSAYNIESITYDPVHYRVLFADVDISNISISSFDLLTRKIQPLLTRISSGYSVTITYDPVTQLLFWKQYPSIYSLSLNPAASNNALDENTLVTSDDLWMGWDIAVDSCGGYVTDDTVITQSRTREQVSTKPSKCIPILIELAQDYKHIYWTTDDKIERIRFDGSEREVIIESTVDTRLSLAIDQQTQRMFWIDRILKNNDYHGYIVSADFNGQNRKTLYEIIFDKTVTLFSSLAISKDFIYWRVIDQKAIWKLPKNSNHEEPKSFSISDNRDWYYQIVAANYTITELTEENPNCKTLSSLIPNALDSDSKEETLVCFHGTKVSGESRCICTQGYTGEKCDVSSCHNYCFQGKCSASAEGQPICRCNAGYSGELCDVNACHMYCLNNGDCSLNEAGKPVCECSADYEGERCEVAATHSDDYTESTISDDHTDSTTQHVLRDLH